MHHALFVQCGRNIPPYPDRCGQRKIVAALPSTLDWDADLLIEWPTACFVAVSPTAGTLNSGDCILQVPGRL